MSHQKLQRVQNAAARIVLNLKKFDHITPAFTQLHWLPIKCRIRFKVALLVFKALHNMSPKYISDMIVITWSGRYCLRSNSEVVLYVPRYKCVTLGRRAFAIHGPITWNSLPSELRSISDLEQFKRKLKTYLFTDFINNGF